MRRNTCGTEFEGQSSASRRPADNELRGRDLGQGCGRRARLYAALVALFLITCVNSSFGDLNVTYGFTPNASIPDGNGQFSTTVTLGGLSSFSNVTVNMNLTSPNPDTNPMWLGDMYSTLTIGTASEANRTAVLLNRPGVNNTDSFGSGLSSLDVTFEDSASHPNIWGTSSSTGTYNSDGRLGVNPYGPGVAFNNGDRNATLAALNGSALASNKFTLLVADTSSGGQAQLSSWGMTVTGTAAASGTMSAAGGTMSITDDGGTNNLGADVVTTQNGSGGVLNVTATGTLTLSGAVTGSGGLTKSGDGNLTLSHSTGNSYTGNTIVNAGSLLVTNTTGSGTGTGSVTVNNSGTILGGTGTIAGSVAVNAGAILRGGTGTAATGALTLQGTVTLNASSIIQLALGAPGAHSSLVSTGAAWSFQANQAFNFINLGAQVGTYNNIISGLAADPGTTATWQITNGDLTGSFQYDGNGGIDLILSEVTPVPEPGTWIAGGLALASLLFSRRGQLRHFGRRGHGGWKATS